MKRLTVRPGTTTGLVTTSAVSGGTAAASFADDFPEPFAALSLIAVTALAVGAVCRLRHRSELTELQRVAAERQLAIAERQLAEERARRAFIEGEYAGLVNDYNELIIEQAQRVGAQRSAGHDHGPRCQCGRRGPQPYLQLVEPLKRQGSA